MDPVLFTVNEVRQMVEQGWRLLLAGDEQALRQIPPGAWIGGTIPYFIGETGGVTTREKLYVTRLPNCVEAVEIKIYDEAALPAIYTDIPQNGFGFIILPGISPIHFTFALRAPDFLDHAVRPLIGWVSGVHLNDLGKQTPRVFSGKDLSVYENHAVVMHVRLPREKIAEIGIVTIFEQGDGDTITFLEDGFQVKEAYINGKKRYLADYVTENKLDIRLPLVADYYGAPINVSFQSIDLTKREINFFAPVYKGVQYRHARPVKDYLTQFTSCLPGGEKPFFSCNCILNYLYSELEGRQVGSFTGPITFGEVAYQLLNQTMVYMNIT